MKFLLASFAITSLLIATFFAFLMPDNNGLSQAGMLVFLAIIVSLFLGGAALVAVLRGYQEDIAERRQARNLAHAIVQKLRRNA